jgi:hypothetical protein
MQWPIICSRRLLLRRLGPIPLPCCTGQLLLHVLFRLRNGQEIVERRQPRHFPLASLLHAASRNAVEPACSFCISLLHFSQGEKCEKCTFHR